MLRISLVLRNSFLIRNNFNSLFIAPTRNGFKIIQGIRALNMIGLLLCHMVMAKMFLPYINKTEMSQVNKRKHFSKYIILLENCMYLKYIFSRICQNHG